MKTVRMGLMGILFVAVGLSGILKLLALDEFAESLATWDIIPSRVIVPVSVLVPITELSLCGAWFAFLLRRLRIELTAFMMLSVVTGIYAFQGWMSELPSCGCLGLWQKHYDQIATGQTLVWRNGVILALIGASVISRIVEGRAMEGRSRATEPRVHSA